MSGRNGLNPNVDSPPADHTRRAEWATPTADAARERIREEARTESAALDATVSAREANSRREVPRLRDEAVNPNKARQLPEPSALRGLLSSNRKKDYNKHKGAWLASLPKTRFVHVSRTLTNRKKVEGVNQALHSVVGVKSDLPPATRRRVESLDRTIQDYEAQNDREHVVYAVLRPPVQHGNSRHAMVRSLRRMSEKGDGRMTFDSYIPSTHSLGQIKDSQEVVMEIRTKSGAYLGSSDTTLDASHIIGRGRVLRPVGVHEVTYTKADRTQGTRTVVQMEDVTPD